MNRPIDEFTKKIFQTAESFMIEGKRKYHFFIQSNVGKARYIYSITSLNSKDFIAGLDLKPELAAIVSEDKIYIVNEYIFDILSSNVELPENVHILCDIVKKENEQVRNVIFPEFYSNLPVNEITEEAIINNCKNKARQLLLTSGGDININLEETFNAEDIAKSICGIINLNSEAYKRLNDDREHWINKKSFNQMVRKFIDNKSVVKLYEMEIVAGLKSVPAKTVWVEFEMNGKTASAKMSPKEIINCMINQSYFSDFEFENRKRGAEVIKELNAANWRASSDGRKVLTCEHITKITYGKKVVYTRLWKN